MLLGHWYLVAPKLAFRHLVIFCRVLLATVFLRLLAVGARLAVAAGVDERVEPNPLRLVAGFEGQGIFFWFRLLWGLASSCRSSGCRSTAPGSARTSPPPASSTWSSWGPSSARSPPIT